MRLNIVALRSLGVLVICGTIIGCDGPPLKPTYDPVGDVDREIRREKDARDRKESFEKSSPDYDPLDVIRSPEQIRKNKDERLKKALGSISVK